MNGNAEQETSLRSAGQRRYKAMADAAYSLFVDKGYVSVTVDDIIQIAGGSKASFYKFFGSKEGILKAVIESLAEEMISEIQMSFSLRLPIRETFRRIGMSLAELVLSDNAINQFRLAIVNSKVFPAAAKLWFESGPNKSFEGLTEHLDKEVEAGRLRITDTRRAAMLFFGMIGFEGNMKRLIGAPPPPRSELEALVNEAVDVFLAAYGV